jgi:glutathione S-transferase
MSLPGGLNAEGELPAEHNALPVSWTTNDLKAARLTLHDMKASPPCIKIRTLFSLHGIAYESLYERAPGAYTKRPVLRIQEGDITKQINDSHVILQCLAPILDGRPMSPEEVELERFVTKELMISFEARAFSTGVDLHKFALVEGYGSMPASSLWMPLVRDLLSYKYHQSMSKSHPEALNSTPAAQMQRLTDALKDQAFFAGAAPGVVDCCVYGALAPFIEGRMAFAVTALREAPDGTLQAWYDRMTAKVPSVSLFPWLQPPASRGGGLFCW